MGRHVLEVTLLAAVPWLHVALIGAILGFFLVPRAAEGQLLAGVAAVILAIVGIPTLFAAVVFSTAVVRGRYPKAPTR